jgi:hypothetical protein
MLGTRSNPQTGLGFNFLDGNMRGCMLVAEDPCVAFIPNFPSNKERERGYSLPTRSGAPRHHVPPLVYGEIGPLRWMDGWDANPLLDGTPNPNGKTAHNEEVVNGLEGLVAKGASVAI